MAEDALAVLGHEIRNPLSALSYALQSWPAKEEDPHVTEHLLQIMRRQVNQLTRLCNDLLDTRRNGQGGLTIRRSIVDLRESLQNACEEIQPFSESRGNTLTFELGSMPIMLYCDESRLTQVFANLMHNAVKFTDRGGHLHLSVARKRNKVVIQVTDNGRGMRTDQLRSLFHSKANGSFAGDPEGQGLGIGLRLAKSIVELHGGTIEAVSEGLGHGCTFIVTLPMLSESPLELEEESYQNSTDERCDKSCLRSYRILIVDDNRAMRFLMTRLMQNLNQSVSVAEDGVHALEAINRTRPNVVFLDLQMSGMNGYEVARQIRSRIELRSVVLIALSGSTDPMSRKLATESGFDYFLGKPTSLTELTETLKSL